MLICYTKTNNGGVMNYKYSLDFFELDDSYTESGLKKKYHSLLKKYNSDNLNLKKIDDMYQILLSELAKKNFKSNILKLKEKYHDTKIYDICLFYEDKLNSINELSTINKLKKKFNEVIHYAKKEFVIPSLKENLLKRNEKYLTGYSKSIRELVNKYSNLIKEVVSLEELNTLKQKYNKLIKKELSNEKRKIKELNELKEELKIKCVSSFCLYAKDKNLDVIITAHKLLITILELLELSNLDNILEIKSLILSVDYSNMKETLEKFKLYYLEKNKSIRPNSLKINKINTTELTNQTIDNEIYNLILDKYYEYTLKKTSTITKLIKNELDFEEIFKVLKRVNQKKYVIVISYIKQNSFNHLKMLIEAINDFFDLSKIYIERETGNICVIKENKKKIYTIYLSGKLINNLENKKDIVWKYISLEKFFMVSKYTNGLEINQVFGKKMEVLEDNDINYLYYTSDLVLTYKDNKFKFIPALKGYSYVINDTSKVLEISFFDKFKDRNYCLEKVLAFIENKLLNQEELL